MAARGILSSTAPRGILSSAAPRGILSSAAPRGILSSAAPRGAATSLLGLDTAAPSISAAIAGSFAWMVNFALNLLVTITNGPFIDAMGQAAIFGFYAVVAALAIAFQ